MPILSSKERIGTRIAGKYELREILGEGGMGTVFGAVHAWTSREVALKLLKPQYSNDSAIVKRFLAEARSAARIQHPHVVDVLDMGQDQDGAVFLVLERLDGEPLTKSLRRRALTPNEAVALLEPVIDALGEAHEAHQIVHRDIKPDNIFIARDPRQGVVPKVLDFGIAKLTGDTFSADTNTGTVIGTPWYMSPEQVLGDKGLGPKSDVWSIAVVIYEAVTRRRPIAAQNPTAALAMIVSSDPTPIAEALPDLPEAFCEVIDRSLSREASERPSMRELAEQLKRAVELDDAEAAAIRSRFRKTELADKTEPIMGAPASLATEVPADTLPLTDPEEGEARIPPADLIEQGGLSGIASVPGTPSLTPMATPSRVPERRRSGAVLLWGGVVLGLALAVFGGYRLAASARSESEAPSAATSVSPNVAAAVAEEVGASEHPDPEGGGEGDPATDGVEVPAEGETEARLGAEEQTNEASQDEPEASGEAAGSTESGGRRARPPGARRRLPRVEPVRLPSTPPRSEAQQPTSEPGGGSSASRRATPTAPATPRPRAPEPSAPAADGSDMWIMDMDPGSE